MDAALARYARAFTVPELARIADRLVQTLNPPSPDGAHQRRYLQLSPLADGSLYGKFFCGPAQALHLTAIITALAAPRPGSAVDADGVTIDLPDHRTAPATPPRRPLRSHRPPPLHPPPQHHPARPPHLCQPGRNRERYPRH